MQNKYIAKFMKIKECNNALYMSNLNAPNLNILINKTFVSYFKPNTGVSFLYKKDIGPEILFQPNLEVSFCVQTFYFFSCNDYSFLLITTLKTESFNQ